MQICTLLYSHWISWFSWPALLAQHLAWCPWFFTISISRISSCMKKIKVWSTLVWKRKIKEPQERSGCIHFLLEIKTSSWKNLQASKRKIKTDCRSWKMFSKIFWCKKRSKCAQVSHIHALKVGQLFLSVRNQVQIVYLVPFFAKK